MNDLHYAEFFPSRDAALERLALSRKRGGEWPADVQKRSSGWVIERFVETRAGNIARQKLCDDGKWRSTALHIPRPRL